LGLQAFHIGYAFAASGFDLDEIAKDLLGGGATAAQLFFDYG
jgi:hypothetical protein